MKKDCRPRSLICSSKSKLWKKRTKSYQTRMRAWKEKSMLSKLLKIQRSTKHQQNHRRRRSHCLCLNLFNWILMLISQEMMVKKTKLLCRLLHLLKTVQRSNSMQRRRRNTMSTLRNMLANYTRFTRNWMSKAWAKKCWRRRSMEASTCSRSWTASAATTTR